MSGNDDLIFLHKAPIYWSAGLPVIPLQVRDKMPVIKAWSQFADRMPTEQEQVAWLDCYPTGNVGLPLGSTSGLVALDVDTDDPVILGIIDKVFPPSPWRRVGQRGYVQLYRYSGQRGFKIKTSDGTSLCDFLSRGQQVVLPPSIHPKTQQPYIANCELLDILASLPTLPANIEEVLKDALRIEGIETAVRGKHKMTEFVSSGSRDNELVRTAGYWASAILKGEVSLLEAFDKIDVYQSQFIERVHGDELPEGKGREKLVEMLLKDVFGVRKRTLPAGWDDGLNDAQKEALGLGNVTELNRRFNYDEILVVLQDFMEKGIFDQKTPAQMMEPAETICFRVAGNADISKLQEDTILRTLSQASGGQLNVASLRRRVVELRQGDIKGTDHAELGKAVLADFERSGEVRFDQEQLWQWLGSHWGPLSDGLMINHIISEYGSYPAARKNGDHQGILKTVKHLCSKKLRAIDLDGINFVNGYLTEDLVLRPHLPDYGMNYVLPYPYLPELAGKTPLWLGMLGKYWGKDEDFAEKVDALQQAMAVTMFGVAPRFQRAFLLHGVPYSGKSRILAIMQGLMPDGCYATIPPAKWGGPFDLAELSGKLLNIAGELGEHSKIAGEVFKQVIVGEEMGAQRKHQPLFKFKPKAAHWFGSNHLPKSNDSSEGFTRRWLLLNFKHALKPADKIEDYDKEVLFHERAAITAWAVQGIVALRAQNGEYTLPKSHTEQMSVVANQNNSVRFFLESLRERGRILLGADEHEGKSNITSAIDPLYVEYRGFCIAEASVSPVASQSFLSRLEEMYEKYGYQVVRRDVNGVMVPELKYLTVVGPRRAAA